MLQRQIMFKQFQELQRRQQLQELGDGGKQNYVNQQPSLKPGSGSQFASPVNGSPLHDSSQMFVSGNMNMIQHGGSVALQGFSNGLGLSLAQNQYVRPMNFQQQQFGAPLYSHLQGSPNDSPNMLVVNKTTTLEMPNAQSSAFGNSIINQRCDFSSDQICIPDGALLPNEVFEEKSLFGQVPFQGFGHGNLHGNYSQQGNAVQRDASILGSEGRQKQDNWHALSPGNVPKQEFSQPNASLDPLEQKILYDTDDNMGAGGYASTLDLTSYMDEVPSMQSGSWSALMQSAVAETSSGDTGIQEGWSGLSIQNTEPSTDNQASNYIESGKLQKHWVDKNMQNLSSPSSKPEMFFQNSSMNYRFPGFQQSGDQYLKQRDESHSESSHSSIQQSPRNTSKWSDYNPQQKHPGEESRMIQSSSPLPNFWLGQHQEHSKGNESVGRLQGTTTQNVTGSQKPFDQSVESHSFKSEKIDLGNNFVTTSNLFGARSRQVQSATAQTSENTLDLLNKDDMSIEHTHGNLNSNGSTQKEVPLTESFTSFGKPYDVSSLRQGFGLKLGLDQQTPQSYPLIQNLSVGKYPPTSGHGNSSAISPSSHTIQNHHPSTPPPSHLTSQFPGYNTAISGDNSQMKNINTYNPEFPISGSVAVSQPSLTSGVPQYVGLPHVWPDMLHSPNLALSGLQATAGPSREQHNQNSSKQGNSAYSGKSECHELRSGREGSHTYGSTEVDSSASQGRSTHVQETLGKNHLEADVASGSLMPSNMAHQTGNQIPEVPARDTGALGNPARDTGALGNPLTSLYTLQQNYPFLQQVKMASKPVEGDSSKSLQIKAFDRINNQQPMTDARQLFPFGQKPGAKDSEKTELGAVSELSAFGDNNQVGKASSSHAYLHNPQRTVMFAQNDLQNPSISNNEASNLPVQSQISMQMAPSWFKHYGTFKNDQMRPKYGTSAEISGRTLVNLPENSSIMQMNSASQGSSIWPITAVTSVASTQLPPADVLPSDVTYQNLAASRPKKRKTTAFDILPWREEVTRNSGRLQNIGMAELEWSQATNKIFEEVKMDALFSEDVPPVVRAKRRLIVTTQLMQQVLRPAPAVILSADANSNYDFVVYFAARLTLGDACSLAGNPKLSPDTSDMLPEKLTSKRTGAYDFSKVAEGLSDRVKKLESHLTRLEKSLSITDIKAESQELEKFAMINRLARFHGRAHQVGADTASSSGATQSAYKMNLQRYIIAVPVPRTIPDGTNCLSL